MDGTWLALGAAATLVALGNRRGSPASAVMDDYEAGLRRIVDKALGGGGSSGSDDDHVWHDLNMGYPDIDLQGRGNVASGWGDDVLLSFYYWPGEEELSLVLESTRDTSGGRLLRRRVRADWPGWTWRPTLGQPAPPPEYDALVKAIQQVTRHGYERVAQGTLQLDSQGRLQLE